MKVGLKTDFLLTPNHVYVDQRVAPDAGRERRPRVRPASLSLRRRGPQADPRRLRAALRRPGRLRRPTRSDLLLPLRLRRLQLPEVQTVDPDLGTARPRNLRHRPQAPSQKSKWCSSAGGGIRKNIASWPSGSIASIPAGSRPCISIFPTERPTRPTCSFPRVVRRGPSSTSAMPTRPRPAISTACSVPWSPPSGFRRPSATCRPRASPT